VRVLEVVHQPDAPGGVFGDVARELGHEVVTWRVDQRDGAGDAPDAVMVYGGAMNVDEQREHPWLELEKDWLRRILDQGTPALGVCLGAQLLADTLGAEVGRAAEPEIGWYEIELTAEADGDPLLGAAESPFSAFEWHSYGFKLPPGSVPLARRGGGLQAFRHGDSCWGIQFHAEVTSKIVADWLADYRSDEDAVRMEIDPAALNAESAARMPAWNEFGRALARRFLDAAANRP
jgi:GMP synthase (glutamine-hydrolysing)